MATHSSILARGIPSTEEPGGLQSLLSPSDVRLFVTSWTVAQEYRRGVPLPPPGDLPDPRMEPASSASPALQAATR